jgi:predicted metalloprotease with PDZ domain
MDTSPESDPLMLQRADGKVPVIINEQGSLGAVIDSETLFVTKVSTGTAAGLRVGDRIVSISGAEAHISIGDDNIVPGTRFFTAVHRALRQRPMHLLVERGAGVPSLLPHNESASEASEEEAAITSTESDPLMPQRAVEKVLVFVTERDWLGAVFDGETLFVTEVSAGSIAAAAGLRVGDRIVRIIGVEAINVGDDNIVPGTKFFAEVHRALRQRPMHLLFQRGVQRRGEE